MAKYIRKAVITAAGKGTRFFPISREIPKEMLFIIDRPVIEYVIDEILSTDVDEIIVVTTRKKKQLIQYLKELHKSTSKGKFKDIELKFCYQTGDKYGDAIPVLSARKFVGDEPFLLHFGDSFSLGNFHRLNNLIKLYEDTKKNVVSLIPISKEQTKIYAVPRILGNNQGKFLINGIKKSPGPGKATSYFGAPNGFVLKPEIFQFMDQIKPFKGEYSLISALNLAAKKETLIGQVFLQPFFEAGNMEDFAKSTIELSALRSKI